MVGASVVNRLDEMKELHEISKDVYAFEIMESSLIGLLELQSRKNSMEQSK